MRALGVCHSSCTAPHFSTTNLSGTAVQGRLNWLMSLKIDQDYARFRNIVRGKIREGLRKYISQGDMIGRKGKDLVSIPIPQIDIPRFTFDGRHSGGVGQGEGEVGDSLGGNPQEGDGTGKAGKGEGQHMLEVDITLDELADILGQELELPD